MKVKNNQPYKSKTHKNFNSALAWKKDQNDRDRFTKAKMLRDYAKLCVKEGVVSDRVNTNNSGQKPHHKQQLANKGKKNPFEKAELLAKSKEVSSIQKESNSQAIREKEIKQAARKRKETSKIYQARTKKGQPYLSKISSVLLEKISAQMK